MTLATREPIPDGYITVSTVSGLLDLSEDYIYRLSRRGKLPGELVGAFCFKDEAGIMHTAKRIWEKAKIIEIAKTPLKKEQMVAPEHQEPKVSALDSSIPSGFLKASEAAKLLGISINTLICKSETGQLPWYRWHQYITPQGRPSTVRIWCKNELKKYIPLHQRKTNEKVLPGYLQALLSHLSSYAKDSIVDGDATDLIFGNPAREKSWADINALAKVGALEWSLDNWERLVIVLDPDWLAKEQRCPE